MSDENRDDATGQFTSAEPLTGLAGIERDAGYVPYVPLEEPRDETNALTVAEAKEQLTVLAPEPEIKDYDGIDLPDNVTLTVEQAADIKTDMDAADHAQAELEENEATRKWHDDLLGVKPEAKDAKAEAAKEAPAAADDGGLDPEVAAAFSNPKIKGAIDQLFDGLGAVRQQHLADLSAATEIVRAELLSRYPAIGQVASLPAEQRDDAIRSLMQNDPGMAAQMAADFQRTNGIFEQQRVAHEMQELQRQAQLANHVKAESARFEQTIKDVPRERRESVEKEIAAAFEERGANMGNVVKFLQTSEASSAEVQGLLWELGETRLQLKAIQGAKKAVAAKNLPPVLRPGTSRPAVSNDSARIQALNAKPELTVREATELVTLQSRRRA